MIYLSFIKENPSPTKEIVVRGARGENCNPKITYCWLLYIISERDATLILEGYTTV